jgi:hypothetical protein
MCSESNLNAKFFGKNNFKINMKTTTNYKPIINQSSSEEEGEP